MDVISGPRRPVRLAVLGLYHEANTFSRVLADLARYRADGWHTGDEMLAHYRESHSVVSGFIQAGSEDRDVELVPLPVGFVTPCGPVSAQARRVLLDELLSALGAAGRIDAVLLVLHGAAVAEDDLHLDATIAEAVRAAVGPSVPVGTVLDMHANVEQRLVDAVDLTLAYQTNPHVDARVVAAECGRLIIDMARTGRRTVTVLKQLPLVVTIVKQDTSTEPMAGLLRLAREIEAEPGMVDVSLVEGFPYADVEQMGMSVLATHADAETARKAADRLAEAVWLAREELQGTGVTPSEAITAVMEHQGGAPLLLLDVGDNVGGGATGDSTVLIAEAIARRVAGVGATLFDPEAADSVATVPVGGRVEIRAGGHSGEHGSAPVLLAGTVTGHHTGLYEEPKIAHGGFRFFDGGDMTGIRTDDGVHVVLTSKSVQPISPTQYRVVGIEPAALTAVIGKGVNGPRAGFADVCEGLVVVDTPGITRNSVVEFQYRNRRTPLYPFEPDTAHR